METVKFELMRMIVLMQTTPILVKAFKEEGYGGDIAELKMLAENDIVNGKAVMALKRVFKKHIVDNPKLAKKYDTVIEEKCKKPQYVLITVEERSGDREYTNKVARKLDGNVDPMKWADENIAKTWLDDDDAEATDQGYSFYGGCYLVHISRTEEITREEFEVLSKYL